MDVVLLEHGFRPLAALSEQVLRLEAIGLVLTKSVEDKSVRFEGFRKRTRTYSL